MGGKKDDDDKIISKTEVSDWDDEAEERWNKAEDEEWENG